MNHKTSFVSWNVRGLGRNKKCIDVKSTFSGLDASFIFLQETKLDNISVFKAASFLPPSLCSFHFLPSIGSAGGTLTAWNDQEFACSSVTSLTYYLTLHFEARANDDVFSISNIYGPCGSTDKKAFADELLLLWRSVSGPWALLGDFNFFLRPSECSNDNFNHLEAAMFSSTLNLLHLQELPLLDRLFTWSNQQDSHILVRLDRVFINTDWSFLFPDSALTSACRSTLDHVPLTLSASSKIPKLPYLGSIMASCDLSLLKTPSYRTRIVSNNCRNIYYCRQLLVKIQMQFAKPKYSATTARIYITLIAELYFHTSDIISWDHLEHISQFD